jgi:hypothetical protein
MHHELLGDKRRLPRISQSVYGTKFEQSVIAPYIFKWIRYQPVNNLGASFPYREN